MIERSTDSVLTVLIASPLESEYAEQIAGGARDRVRVVYEPDLLPIAAYRGDHAGHHRDLPDSEIARWRSMLQQAEVLFDFDWLDPEEMQANCPRLRWVQATSAGIGEYLERTGLARSRITFTTAAGVHSVPLAEFVALGLLYLCKDVPRLRQQQGEHHWERSLTNELGGRKALLIGLGNVGRKVAETCASLGVEVLGRSRSLKSPPAGVKALVPRTELRPALASADILVIACPLTKETHHLIGREELRLLPRGSFVINIGRGPVMDEAELVAALGDGHIGGAALDVFEREPLPPDSPLWDFPNVLVSPHSASTVSGENQRIVDLFIDNLERYVGGRELRNVFMPARGY